MVSPKKRMSGGGLVSPRVSGKLGVSFAVVLSIAILAIAVFRLQYPPNKLSRSTETTQRTSSLSVAPHSLVQLPYLLSVEERVLKALSKRNGRQAIDKPAEEPMSDFRASKFFLSPGRPLYSSMGDFEFRHWKEDGSSPQTWIQYWKQSQEITLNRDTVESTKRIVCHVQRGYGTIQKWQHYMQLLFPCYSMLLRFPNAQERIVALHPTQAIDPDTKKTSSEQTWSGWVTKLNEYYQLDGIQFADDPQQFLKNKNKTNDLIAFAGLNNIGEGRPDPEGEGPFDNSYYFMGIGDIHRLQKVVLGEMNQYQWGPSLLGNDNHNSISSTKAISNSSGIDMTSPLGEHERLRLVVLNREGAPTRFWKEAKTTHEKLKSEWGDILDVVYTPSYDALTFEEQALNMHTTDVIVMPHGAQMTNSVFLRPCSVVLELLPRYFYSPRKGVLVLETGSIHYTGYKFDGSPVSETDEPDWKDGNKLPVMHTSPQSILFAMPDLLSEAITCRKQWLLEHSATHASE